MVRRLASRPRADPTLNRFVAIAKTGGQRGLWIFARFCAADLYRGDRPCRIGRPTPTGGDVVEYWGEYWSRAR
jgi:hypothetical protein